MSLVALLYGKDRPGLVAEVSSWILQHSGNIIHADQHCDLQAGIFFQRVVWDCSIENKPEIGKNFGLFAKNTLDMNVKVYDTNNPLRVAVMVSKTDHCFHDLVLRFKSGELVGNLVSVISNHPNLEKISSQYKLPYYFIPINSESKKEAESKLIRHLSSNRIDLLVLARYMQILSSNFLEDWGKSVINIHHSFLPAFVGSKPYHQAYQRGVKIIGATAHYVTKELDAGPIIQQDVTRINHRHSIDDLICRGKDLEKIVLSKAVKWHLEHRILTYNNKTVVFE